MSHGRRFSREKDMVRLNRVRLKDVMASAVDALRRGSVVIATHGKDAFAEDSRHVLGRYIDVRHFFTRGPIEVHELRQVSGMSKAVRDSFKANELDAAAQAIVEEVKRRHREGRKLSVAVACSHGIHRSVPRATWRRSAWRTRAFQ